MPTRLSSTRYTPRMMTFADATRRGEELLKQAAALVEGTPAPTINETIAAVFFRLSAQHLNAMLLLLNRGLRASAFALLRPCVEAGLRGLYVEHCMDEEQIRNAMEDQRSAFGTFRQMVEKLQTAMNDASLFAHLPQHFGMLSNYTHGGSRQIVGAVDDQGRMTEVHSDEDCVNGLLEAVYIVVYVCGRLGMKGGRWEETHALARNYNQFETDCEPSQSECPRPS